MKILTLAILFVNLLAVPAFAYPTYTGGDDGQHLYNGVYNDWQPLVWPSYPTFDMGSQSPIWSVGVHFNTLGGLVHSIYVQFSNDGTTWPGYIVDKDYSIVRVMDNSGIIAGEVYWAIAYFEPVLARYCRFFADSTGTYIQTDEFMINGLDGADNPVLEPSSLLALGGGLVGLAGIKRRKGKREK